MKKASLILSHLGNLPQFAPLKKQKCYQKFISLLGAKWQKIIAFVYLRDDTLFVAVKHPGFKMELNYNRDLLKSVLTKLRSTDGECSDIKADKIVIFHSRFYPITQENTDLESVPRYHEIASPNFLLLSRDTAIRKRFHQLQKIIASNRQAPL